MKPEKEPEKNENQLILWRCRLCGWYNLESKQWFEDDGHAECMGCKVIWDVACI